VVVTLPKEIASLDDLALLEAEIQKIKAALTEYERVTIKWN
jgi:hypothetical protein